MSIEQTPLDAAARAMEAASGTDLHRLRFHERLLDAELFLLLDSEPEDERIVPRIFDLEEGRFVLVFDRDDRLAAFLEAPAPYAALAGRRLVELLKGKDLGIGLNLGVAVSATLLPAETVSWLAEMGGGAPELESSMPLVLAPPRDAAPELIASLSVKLAAMATEIDLAYLALARYADRDGLLLALFGVEMVRRVGVAAAIAEAVRFSGTGAALDVTFPPASARLLDRLRAVAVAFDLPRQSPARPTRRAPGTDPDKPPILRKRGRLPS